MDNIKIITICKDLGCCDACCLRFVGHKNPTSFEDPQTAIQKYLQCEIKTKEAEQLICEVPLNSENEHIVPAKKTKTHDVCVSCIGVLQDEMWAEALLVIQNMMEQKRYECDSFSCALSAPVGTVVREKAVALLLAEQVAGYQDGAVTSLKEAWKWARGGELARRLGMRLQPGGAAPLTVTLELGGDGDDAAPSRRAAAAALAGAGAAAARAALAPPARRARALRAAGEHRALVLAGRYVKRSRSLPQTPWLVAGRRVLPSSVQELVLAPLAELLGLDEAEAARRLKFMAAGREDVDVRCLGDGRPFAVEVLDPPREPSPEELAAACRAVEARAGGRVAVAALRPVARARLAELKRGERSKCKTYEALCVKRGAGAAVSAADVARVRAWRGAVVQRTPLRVLHRRPLLARRRRVLRVHAARVAGRPALLLLRLVTAAGTYVKEWAHGELRRSRPALAAPLGAPADILALDVCRVHLRWP